MKKNELVKLEDVWKEYQLGKIKLTVLKDINLVVEKGIFLAILGKSGSGKTTLLNIISQLDTPTKGKVLFEGHDTSHFSDDQLAKIRSKKVGFVFQQFNLIHNLTALENVMLPVVFSETAEQKKEAEAKQILDYLGLAERINHRPSEMSGGEQQRVAIARALINNPELIVADEPTGNIDSKTGELIMGILSELNKKHGKTIIIVTHDVSLATYADKVINIKDGRIVV